MPTAKACPTCSNKCAICGGKSGGLNTALACSSCNHNCTVCGSSSCQGRAKLCQNCRPEYHNKCIKCGKKVSS